MTFQGEKIPKTYLKEHEENSFGSFVSGNVITQAFIEQKWPILEICIQIE